MAQRKEKKTFLEVIMAKRTKCAECGNYNAIVSLTCIEIMGQKKRVWLCERCHDKYEKPFKKINRNENKV